MANEKNKQSPAAENQRQPTQNGVAHRAINKVLEVACLGAQTITPSNQRDGGHLTRDV
jgi:hypothetical protein